MPELFVAAGAGAGTCCCACAAKAVCAWETAGGGLGSAFAAARADMPGSCWSEADAVVEVELGREMGSTGGGGRIWAASSIASVGYGDFGGRGVGGGFRDEVLAGALLFLDNDLTDR